MRSRKADGPARSATTVSGNKPARKHRPILMLSAWSVLLILAVIFSTTLIAITFRERALERAQHDLDNSATLIARQIEQNLDALEHVQKGILESIIINSRRDASGAIDLASSASSDDNHLLLKSAAGTLPFVTRISFVTPDGRLVNSSDFWSLPPPSVADRDYFRALTSDRRLTLYLGEPLRNPASNNWSFSIARKLAAQDGEIICIFETTIDISYFERFFSSIPLGQSASIALLRADGTMLARAPHSDSDIGKVYGKTSGALNDNRTKLVARTVFTTDNKEHLLVARRIANGPLVLTAALETEEVFADWQREKQLLVVVATIAAILIALMFFRIVRQLVLEHKAAQERLAREKRRLDTAMNNMVQGLLLFDSSQQLVISNQRYLEMYGLTPDAAEPGSSLRDVLYRQKEAGGFVENVEDYHSAIATNLTEQAVTTTIHETSDGRSIRVVNKPLPGGGLVSTHEDISAQRNAERQITHLAYHDGLTDLPNRVLFGRRLEQAIKRISRGEQVAVLYLDLDNFKRINDTLGHQSGDELLKGVATRLTACLRETDTVARLGGDEFAIIQTGVQRQTDIMHLVQRVLDSVREPYECCGNRLLTEATIGIAVSPDDGTAADELLKNADLAMFKAKANGRNTYQFFKPEFNVAAKARLAMELELRNALAANEFELHYQPVTDLQRNRIVACEALLRWKHPTKGMVAPVEFIPIAEETGLIIPIGEWVLKTACAVAATWPQDVKVAVNVSPVQFRNGSFGLTVATALAVSGLSARRLEIEITEAILIQDDQAALKIMDQLKQLGVRIVMDDFGTGYSSLGYLQRFPFDKIKIDRLFIQNASEEGSSLAIVQAVVDIAKARGIDTTAEGIETQEQLQLIRGTGCSEAQGYLLGRSIPAPEIQRLLWPNSVEAATAA